MCIVVVTYVHHNRPKCFIYVQNRDVLAIRLYMVVYSRKISCNSRKIVGPVNPITYSTKKNTKPSRNIKKIYIQRPCNRTANLHSNMLMEFHSSSKIGCNKLKLTRYIHLSYIVKSNIIIMFHQNIKCSNELQ